MINVEMCPRSVQWAGWAQTNWCEDVVDGTNDLLERL